MSLQSGGVSISLMLKTVQSNTRTSDVKTVGYGMSDRNDPAAALRQAVENFIESKDFKDFINGGLYNSADIQISLLTHTAMPE